MLKKLIIIEGENQEQCDTEEEVVKLLVHPDYYEMSREKKLESLKMKAMANSLNRDMEILEPKDVESEKDLRDKFVLLDEKTYILSLLRTNRITLLERIDSNVYTKSLDKKKFEKNYIIVNKFVDEILDSYVGDILNKNNIEK